MAILTHLVSSIGDLSPFLVTASVALLTYLLILNVRRIRSMPPGPWGLPIVGIMLNIKKEFHLFLTDYSKVFGKIFSLSMGRESIVVLSDYKLIKKAFQNRDFTARPKTELTDLLGGYGKTIFKIFTSEQVLFKGT